MVLVEGELFLQVYNIISLSLKFTRIAIAHACTLEPLLMKTSDVEVDVYLKSTVVAIITFNVS